MKMGHVDKTDACNPEEEDAEELKPKPSIMIDHLCLFSTQVVNYIKDWLLPCIFAPSGARPEDILSGSRLHQLVSLVRVPSQERDDHHYHQSSPSS
jgi:hypothetical protein